MKATLIALFFVLLLVGFVGVEGLTITKMDRRNGNVHSRTAS